MWMSLYLIPFRLSLNQWLTIASDGMVVASGNKKFSAEIVVDFMLAGTSTGRIPVMWDAVFVRKRTYSTVL